EMSFTWTREGTGGDVYTLNNIPFGVLAQKML
ncbi:hypothetical protein CEXT_236781, partial [Caerostris extrusa]